MFGIFLDITYVHNHPLYASKVEFTLAACNLVSEKYERKI